MNPRLFLTCLCFSGLALSGCSKPEPEAPAVSAAKAQATRPVEPPTPATPPVPAGPSESEKKLAQQVREMQTRHLELELKLEDEKLARTEAEIAKERDLLEQERVAWNREQELAVAKLTPPASDESSLETPSSTTGRNEDYQMFYDDLAPLGSWYDCQDYGYVWQPAVCITDNTWRPYTLGSWANCDQGWAWCSDEPFGWACYHYGRWALLRGRGWVWVPGDQWAPCWVSWRRNDTYIGWCPLPPETVYNRDCTYGPAIDVDCGIHPGCYVFMPVKHFDRPCRNYCEAPVTCLTICSTTVCITNITVRPGRVDCHGPKYDWIKDCVRRPMPRYKLAREAEFAGVSHRGPRFENDKIRFFAPKVQAPWNTHLRPARHGALDSKEIVRAESGLPDKLAVRYRAEKQERAREAGNLKGGAKGIAERQLRLAGLEQARESLREQRARGQAVASAAVPDSAAAHPARPERDEKPQNRPGKQVAAAAPSSRALPVPETPSTASPSQPGRADVTARRDQSIAPKTAVEQARQEEAAPRREVAANDRDQQDGQSSLRAALEEKRRQQREAGAVRAPIAAQPAMEQQPRAAETAARHDSTVRADAVAREMEKQAALRAQLEERRRQQQEAQNDQSKAQAAARRDAMEQRRTSEAAARTETARNEAAGRESDKQASVRAAQEQQRRQADAEAKSEQQARQREAMEQQRAAHEQQRRQADAEAQAGQQRRQAEEMQRRQAETETRQRQAQQEEQQRRSAEEQQRRQAEESQRRQAEAESRQRDMEQRRQAEEQQRRQADERAKEASEQQRRQAENQDREERGRGKR